MMDAAAIFPAVPVAACAIPPTTGTESFALFIKLEKLFYVGMFKFRFRNMDSHQHSFPVFCNISIDSGKDADHGNVCN